MEGALGTKRGAVDDLADAAVKLQKTDDTEDDAPLAQPYVGGDDDEYNEYGKGDWQSAHGETAKQLPNGEPLGQPVGETEQTQWSQPIGQQLQPVGQPRDQTLGQPLEQTNEQVLGQPAAQPKLPMLEPLQPVLGQPMTKTEDELRDSHAAPFGSPATAKASPIDLATLSPTQATSQSFDLTDQPSSQEGMPDVYNLAHYDGDDLDMGNIQDLEDLSGMQDDEDVVEPDFSVTEKRRKSRMEVTDEPEAGDRQIFSPYSCPKLPEDAGAVPHCGEVVETSSLAAVEPPEITHKCLIPDRVIREGRLSDLQWEAVNYAGQRHSQFNKDGSRGGFMLGDGTGVGKGRTCAGVIYDYFMHERKERAEAPASAPRPTRPIICVWVSVSWDLAQDATRDLSAITEPLDDQKLEEDMLVNIRRGNGVWEEAETVRPEHDARGSWWVSVADRHGNKNQEIAAGEDIRAPVLPVVTVKETQAASFNLDKYMHSGLVIFATYSVFSRGDASTGLTRLRELLAPVGQEYLFEGVVAFDEAHNAKNLVAGRGKASKTGLHVKKLQDDFESARIVYASATGASEVRNMGYMTRLGLWGEGTPFSDFAKVPPGKRNPAFLPELKRGGFGAMELVGMDLKAQGRYLCRTLSFKGATFDVHEARLGPEERKVYDEAASMWQRLIVICKNGRFWSAIEGVNLKTFWAAQQLFFRQLLCAFKVKHTIKLITDALANDRSVIVGVQLTGDSRVQEMLKELMRVREDEAAEEEEEFHKGQGGRRTKKSTPKAPKKRGEGPGELEDAFSSTKETFSRLIENCWSQTENISIPQVRALRKGKTFVEVFGRAKSRKTGPGISEAQVRRHKIWKDLADRAEALKFPVNPIDGIIQAFGPEQVAEVTGRRLRAELREHGRVEYVSRANGVPQAKLNLSEQRAFVSGKKRVIIISQAGSSGISLHAGFDYLNQQPRTHIILELPWSSEQLIQQCGRSHRSNQMSAPEFIAISTDVAGETRFAMSVAARMQSLGALTKSDRRAAHCTSEALSRFNFVTKHGRNALKEVQCKTQVQALARLAGNSNSKVRAQQQQGAGQLQDLGVQGQLSEQTKRELLGKLGLHESATNTEMREKFIARGIVCFVDRQMADREVKALKTTPQQRGNRNQNMLKQAESNRGAAARRLQELKNAYEGVSGEQAIPMEWTPNTHSLFPSPVKRAIAEVLRVFKQKEKERFSTVVVSSLNGDSKPYTDKLFGQLPAVAIKNIISFLAVGKPVATNVPAQPRPAKGQDEASFKASPAYRAYQEKMKKQQIATQHVSGWLHPPEPAVELFCLLLLLDVIKAPVRRSNVQSIPYNEYDVGYGNDKIENNLTIETFFNRMLAMSITWQKRVFSYFMDLHENELADAEAAGDSAALAGVTEVGSGRNCSAELKSEVQICVDRESGSAVMRLHIEVESADSRLTCRDALRKLKECGEAAHCGGSSVIPEAVQCAGMGVAEGPKAGASDTRGAVCGFYQQKRSKRTVLVVREERSTTYALWRPNSRTTPERRRLTYRALCERLARFEALPEPTGRMNWTNAWSRLDDRTVESYHLITGPVLACWHVVKDCAARVTNEVDHNAAPEGQVEKEDSDKPDTTLSIVRAVLDDGRRIIGLQIEEGNVEYVESELRRQHETGWGDTAQPEQPTNDLGALQGSFGTAQPVTGDWGSTAAAADPHATHTMGSNPMVEGMQYGGDTSSVGSMPLGGGLGAGFQGAFPQPPQQPPITYNLSDEW